MHSLHYFPCINAFANILQFSTLNFDAELPFQRSSFRNRTIVAGATGPITLSIPVVGGRNVKLPYKEVQIDYTNNWQRDHFRTLCTVYGNSPFYQFYKDEIEELYNTQPLFLFDWNKLCLKWIIDKLKFSNTINSITSSTIAITESENITTQIKEFTPQNYKSPEMGPFVKYSQVFEERNGFQVNLSILDLIFHHGKDAKSFFIE